MPRHVAFLRAVNVAPRWVKMADLRAHLTAHGFTDVETHIQSGNVLVGSDLDDPQDVADRLEETIGHLTGFAVPCMVRTPAELSAIAAEADGIPALLDERGRRYVVFSRDRLGDGPTEALHSWDRDGERARVLGREIVLELGVPFHQTTLTGAQLERLTGTVLTARDLKVVSALATKWGST